MNRKHREPAPEDRQPMPDSGELARDSVRRKPAPSPFRPLEQPPYTTIPDDVVPTLPVPVPED